MPIGIEKIGAVASSCSANSAEACSYEKHLETVFGRCFESYFPTLSDFKCLYLFSFGKKGTGELLRHFRWDLNVTKLNKYYEKGNTVLFVVLRRFVSPCRWEDLEEIFGKKGPVLSEIFWEGVKFLQAVWECNSESYTPNIHEGVCYQV